MASSRKPPSADAVVAELAKLELQGKRLAVGLSGGMDSVVLLHALRAHRGLLAIHVHHGLSPSADAWAAFCRRLCDRLGVRLAVRKVRVHRRGRGLEAAAREARYAAFRTVKCDAVVLAHHLEDQAETVLMNLLRGAGRRGAGGMAARSRLDGKALLRPLLAVPRAALAAYARSHGLEWVEDESNADEALTRNFLRRKVAPLLDARFPGWQAALARAARHFSQEEATAQDLLRQYLQASGLRAPSEAKLVEMLKQLTSGGTRILLEHDGARLRVYRGKVVRERAPMAFSPIAWSGEARLAIPELGGELRFRRARGRGIAAGLKPLQVRLRSGGERLQPDPKRPRRTLKNLFQEAGVPSWERDRLPLLLCDGNLVWVPGLGVDAKYRAAKNRPGVLPEWRKITG